MEIKEYFTVQKAAIILSVSDGAMRAAILQGRLPAVIVYGRKIISHADLEAYKQHTRPEGEKPRGRPRKLQGTQVNQTSKAGDQ